MKALRDLGRVEGSDFVIEWRYADGKTGPLPALAAELVKLNVDVIVTNGTPAVRAARQATTTIPIVTTSFSDPVGSGFAASLARPGGNITGFSNLAEETVFKRLELLISVAPKVTRMARERVGALIVSTDSTLNPLGAQIAGLALRQRLPSTFGVRKIAEAGGLMSYGADYAVRYRRAAAYVDKILKCAKAGDPPIEQPTEFELVVNLITAKALGIKIPNSILMQATKVIQ